MVKQKKDSVFWKLGMRIWSRIYSSAKILDLFNRLSKISRYMSFEKFPGILRKWTRYRKMPRVAPQNFKEIWQKKLKEE